MRKVLVALSSVVLFLQVSEAVRCWKCDNALTNEDCINIGHSVECTGESGGCFSEVRYHWGLIPPIRITKRCKQGLACDNNVDQNIVGGYPFQCNPRFPESNCRCCCATDDCNKPELGCLPDYPDCRSLVVPDNGVMVCRYGVQPPSLGESCEFNCDPGYELIGDKVLVCGPVNNKVSEWNHKEPVCNPLTCEPEYTSIRNGRVDCTNRNYVGSTCNFQCLNGYVMDGHRRATCSPSQNWDHQPPKCIPITCTPPMDSLPSGVVTCSNGNRLLSVCQFECDFGYNLMGPLSSTCIDDGNGDRHGVWSVPMPRCGKLTCRPQSSNPTNGEVDCSDANYGGSVCEYACHGRYSIVGAPQRTCEDDGDGDDIGRWSNREPTCRQVECRPRLYNPRNGQVTCTNQNFLGSDCTYTCNDGFIVDPLSDSETECIDDGNGDAIGVWSRPPPTCKPGKCQPILTDPINGRVTCSDVNYVRSKCTFSCDEGYHLRTASGRDSLTSTIDVICRSDNTWSQQPPTCERIICEPPHRDTDEKIVTCTDSNNYGSVCTWECRNGDPISGQTTSTCRENRDSQRGKWEPANPVNTCKDVVCQPPQIAPQNGRVSCTDENLASSTCTFTCNPGYYLVRANSQPVRIGQYDIDCRRDGTWSDQPPTCKIVVCEPEFENPQFGLVGCTQSNRYGSRCTFRCNRGYEIIGQPTSLCQDSIPGDEFGDWSNPAPICRSGACNPPLIPPTDGTMTCTSDANFRSVCSFKCNPGYYMVSPFGNPVTSNEWESLCRADGSWSNQEPTCEPIICVPEQTTPRGGEVSCTDSNNYLSLCTFTCNRGYRPSTPQVTTRCVDDGNGDSRGVWSHPPSSCVPRLCEPDLKDPANGTVSCTRGSNFGSVCTFRCNKGFYQITAAGVVILTNNLKTECLASDEWSRPPPRCPRIRCVPPHIAPENGRLSCSKRNLYASTCSFTCRAGYSIDGDARSTCQDDGNGDEFGEWSSPPPTCTPINCTQPLSRPNNGEIICTSNNVFGSVCSFICNEGYYMSTGTSVVLSNTLRSECGPRGRWSVSAPICRRITCRPPHSKPTNGNLNCTRGNFYGSECLISCKAGYFVTPGPGGSPPQNGQVISVCVEDAIPGDARGEWTEPTPSCEPDICRDLFPVENGKTTCSNDFVLSSVCMFVCLEGYYMVGPDSRPLARNTLRITCSNQLTWSNNEPTCEAIVCLPVHRDPDGGSVSCTKRNFHGSVCTFKCNRGYEMIGRPRTTCEADGVNSPLGKWSNPAPTCKENLCDETLPLPPVNGVMSCTNANVLGSVCTFTCNRYHIRQGPQSSTCIESPRGPRWSHTTPVCEPNKCEPPRTSLRYGSVSCTKENYVTSVCTFTCTRDDFILYPQGFTTNRCLSSKLWNRRAPCCYKPCPPNARMDAFILLDSSSSVGRSNWNRMKRFIRGIIDDFTISEDTSHFSVLRYNGAVDTRSQIKLNNYTDDKDGLLAAFDKIPYDGSGTMTGQAITYVGNQLMTRANGDRPNVVNLLIVFTDGKSQDGVKAPANELRKRGVITLAVGIGTRINTDQLLEIAGSRDKILTAESFAALTDAFGLQITERVCGHPCDQEWEDA